METSAARSHATLAQASRERRDVVSGEVIASVDTEGKGAAPSADDPDLLIAVTPGQPVLHDNCVVVNPVIEVANVDLESGNITFEGTVKVLGEKVGLFANARIDAAGDYMCIYTGGETLILRQTMKDMEKRLDPRKFQRVHRSSIVNLDLVKQVKPHTNGECFLVLESGAQIKVSRSYRDVVARFVH